MSSFLKDPDAVLDFRWDWSDWLADVADEISSTDFVVPDGITKDSDQHDGEIVTAWLSGGDPGKAYRVTCRITTLGSRTDDRTITVVIRER